MSKKNKSGTKSWVHPPNLLIGGHIVYHVKLLGSVEVNGAKGSNLVKEAVRKIKFNRQVQRAEGSKPPKVDLTISITSICIVDRQNKTSLHSFPLQQISYCADDKTDKRICAFISRNDLRKSHDCYVLESEKVQAEDITLTVGQAFDLAFQKYKDTLNTDPNEAIKKLQQFQQKIKNLESENKHLRSRVSQLEEQLGITTIEIENEGIKERTSSTSSTGSQPTVFQLESFGGTSSTDPLSTVTGEFFSESIFGPSLDSIGQSNEVPKTDAERQQSSVNGVTFQDSFGSPPAKVEFTSSNSNTPGVTFDDTFGSPQAKVDIISSTSTTPVLAPPPRPVRQNSRRLKSPATLNQMNIQSNEIKSPPPTAAITSPASNFSNPFQNQPDWPPVNQQRQNSASDVFFQTQQQCAPIQELSFDGLDPLAT